MPIPIRRLATVILLSAAGLALLIGAAYGGISTTTTISPVPPPPGANVDDLWWDVQSPLDEPVQRAQTVTLMPLLPDGITSTLLDYVADDYWPVRIDDVIYNRPGGGVIRLPVDACNNVTWGLAEGNATKRCESDYTFLDIPLVPDPQPWITFTYWTVSYTVRYQDLVTVTPLIRASASYNPLTCTVIYTRHNPEEREDYWGNTFLKLVRRSPSPTTESIQEAWEQWVANTNEFSSAVVVHEPLFGAHLTVTKILISALTATVDSPTYFTAVLENRGVMTAYRWFPVEMYIKPAYALPPYDIWDHFGGVGTYGNLAFLKPLGNPPESPGWKIETLGPGKSITVQTALTFMTELGYQSVYAQPDVWFDGDPGHYSSIYGSNVEWYGHSQESNIAVAPTWVYVPASYRVRASPPVVTGTAPPGQQANLVVQVRNVGNMTDTYIITHTPALTWAVALDPTPFPGLLPGESHPLTFQVSIPAGVAEGTTASSLATIRSTGDPTRTSNVLLIAIARTPVHLPVVMRNYRYALYTYLPIVLKGQ